MPDVADAAAPDPIFAAIENHRKAYAAMQARFAEGAATRAMADEKVGPCVIEIESMVEPGTMVRARYWGDIEDAVPRVKHPGLHGRYLALLEERQAAHWAAVEALIGDEDEYSQKECDAEDDALIEFARTVPTTPPGLLAQKSTPRSKWLLRLCRQPGADL